MGPQEAVRMSTATALAQKTTAEQGMTDQQHTDRQLVARVQKGDSRAFDLLVIKYQHRILSLVGRYISDFAEAQDVTQEAFIKAYRALPSFRGDKKVKPTVDNITVKD